LTETWGPAARAAYLAAIDQPDTEPGGSGICAEVARAERLAEVALADWSASGDELRDARIAAPDSDLAADRELSPVDRHALVRLWRAEERESRCELAYLRATAKRDRLVAEFDSLSLARER
jgi:hypothetical protein